MSHTPGPWKLETVPISVGHCHKIGAFPAAHGHRKETYACVYVDGLGLRPEDAPELLANARLIAAAPDLLQACQMALNDRMYKDWPPIADALMTAIAKAEGR